MTYDDSMVFVDWHRLTIGNDASRVANKGDLSPFGLFFG
jgi:hypothetical protein